MPNVFVVRFRLKLISAKFIDIKVVFSLPSIVVTSIFTSTVYSKKKRKKNDNLVVGLLVKASFPKMEIHC